jgi:hypothetical protein
MISISNLHPRLFHFLEFRGFLSHFFIFVSSFPARFVVREWIHSSVILRLTLLIIFCKCRIPCSFKIKKIYVIYIHISVSLVAMFTPGFPRFFWPEIITEKGVVRTPRPPLGTPMMSYGNSLYILV